jgi:6-phosphogluconolactonase (cycloisomerase 2 family)
VHSVLVTDDDLVYVADRSNNRLQIFRIDGTFVREVFIARNTLQAEGSVHHFAISPDKAQRFLYVVDGSNKAVRVLNRQTMDILYSVGGHAGHNAREFFHAQARPTRRATCSSAKSTTANATTDTPSGHGSVPAAAYSMRADPPFVGS